MQNIKQKIHSLINDVTDWTNPYLLVEIKAEFPDVDESEADRIYYEELKRKIDSLSAEKLSDILKDQQSASDSNKNYLLIEMIEEVLQSN